MTSKQIEPSTLEELRQLDSCSVANAIEKFGMRLRNTGFTDSTVRCIFEDFSALGRLCGHRSSANSRAANGRG